MTSDERTTSPWASGPAELLEHAYTLLEDDSDSKRRIAMIMIDNSVELIIKTYLGLPTRVTGIQIGRKKLQEIGESFPSLLDALETHAPITAETVDLGVIEWFHTIRNQLYHQGNGVTVEREKADAYAELARQLFEALFEEELPASSDEDTRLLGQFMDEWAKFEHEMLASISSLGMSAMRETPRRAAALLHQEGIFDDAQLYTVGELMSLRNRLVHGEGDYRQELTDMEVIGVNELRQQLQASMESRQLGDSND